MRVLKKRLNKITNPHNLTRLYLKGSGYAIGDFSYGAPKVRRWGRDSTLAIGKFCSIADNVTVFLGGNHRSDWVSTYPFSGKRGLWPEAPEQKVEFSKGDVVIGSDVWIGSGATIHSGVTIGHGAVIGAGAVVAKDVEPYSIVVGNPAREVRKRFEDYIIQELLELAWWNLPRERIVPLIPLLQSDRVRELIDALK